MICVQKSSPTEFLFDVRSWVLRLLITTTVAWSALWISLAFISPISRRACNLPYILWTLAFNLQVRMRVLFMSVLVDLSLLMITCTSHPLSGVRCANGARARTAQMGPASER